MDAEYDHHVPARHGPATSHGVPPEPALEIGLDLEPRFKVYSRPMTSYRISDAARRTGLPTSTLRYYERIGLLPESARTDAGYRAYEERALDRLAFSCSFLSFAIGLSPTGTTLQISGPPDVRPMIEALLQSPA